MTISLRVLIVEDVEADALLILRPLTQGGFTVASQRVETADAMRAALRRQSWDVIISDYSLPTFGAPAAIHIMKEERLDIPFIIVSGTVSDETAAELIRSGAHDFMVKGKYARLVPAIERELREAAIRAGQNKLHEQLLIADRMASVGTLAAGVAHELNSPLAALMANLEYVAGKLAKVAQQMPHELALSLAELNEPLADSRECADRLRHIVRDVKMFSRPSERVGLIDLHAVLESSLRMAFNDLRHRAQVIRKFNDVSLIEGPESSVAQVLLNLIINAAQSIPEGHASDNQITVLTKQEGDRAVVEIHDTGAGLSADEQTRLFQPFSTATPKAIGSGLGLVACQRIVTNMGGHISVQSEQGKGTMIRIAFAGARNVTAAKTLPASLNTETRCRILIVDDDLMLARGLKRMLVQDRHEVTIMTRAAEAVEYLRRAANDFDVVLCDLMMPEVTGIELYEQLEDSPLARQKIAFMTGGAFTERASAFLDRIKNPRAEKPFDSAMLRGLLGEVLKAKSAA